MSYEFRPAVRENVGLLVGLAGASGSGKTYSAMTLARGMSNGERFAVIDTESRRALHYADQFDFDHCELGPPFEPDSYAGAIRAAAEKGYGVVVVDSASHEHAGEGGLLDMQEAEFAKKGYKDAARMSSWIKPKMAHKKMVQTMLRVNAHIILCFRAEEKVEMVRDSNGKMRVQPKRSLIGLDGWVPICEKTLPYELTASFLLIPDRPGMPHPIKLQQQHRSMFPLDKPITEASGKALAVWAAGGESAPKLDPVVMDGARNAASQGVESFRSWWKEQSKAVREMLKPQLADLQQRAEKAQPKDTLV